MPHPFTPDTTPANIRPVTEQQHAAVMIAELFLRCEDNELLIHMAQLRLIRDDIGAVLAYCYQELTALDDRGQRQDIADLRMG